MNKTCTLLSFALGLYCSNSFSSYTSFKEEPSPWTGFYIGANAGYLWSSNNILHNKGQVAFANTFFLPNSYNLATSLEVLGTNALPSTLNSFIGGGQFGYNVQFMERLVLGIDADIDLLSKTQVVSHRIDTITTPLLGTDTSVVEMSRKLNYIGLLNARLGVLVTPSFLFYGSGAFAYGGASLKTNYSITTTNTFMLPITKYTESNRILGGWAAGAGAEWMFSPSWSVKLEYAFYNLGPIHHNFDLQEYLTTTPPIAYATAAVESVGRFTENTVKVGVNYHFS